MNFHDGCGGLSLNVRVVRSIQAIYVLGSCITDKQTCSNYHYYLIVLLNFQLMFGFIIYCACISNLRVLTLLCIAANSQVDKL